LKEVIRWADSTDPSAQFQAARALADLAIEPENQILIAKTGGISPLAKLARSRDPEVHRCAVIAIANLALNDENQTTLTEQGCLPILVGLVQHGSDEVKLHCARALANLAYCHENNEKAIAAQGGLGPLVELAASGGAETQVEATAALANIARNAETQEATLAAGAVEAVLPLLSSTDDETQKQACRCLANLALNEPNRGVMARNDAIVAKLILVCSIGTPDTQVCTARHVASHVQRLAAMALANLSFHDEVQLAITEAGGLEPVFAILRYALGSRCRTAHVLTSLGRIRSTHSCRQRGSSSIFHRTLAIDRRLCRITDSSSSLPCLRVPPPSCRCWPPSAWPT